MMYHVEAFNSKGKPGELEEFMKTMLLPYWRSKGFKVKVFMTQYGLGPAQFWLVTEMEDFASLDKWPEMNSGDPIGASLMARFLELIEGNKASIVKDIEGSCGVSTKAGKGA